MQKFSEFVNEVKSVKELEGKIETIMQDGQFGKGKVDSYFNSTTTIIKPVDVKNKDVQGTESALKKIEPAIIKAAKRNMVGLTKITSIGQGLYAIGFNLTGTNKDTYQNFLSDILSNLK